MERNQDVRDPLRPLKSRSRVVQVHDEALVVKKPPILYYGWNPKVARVTDGRYRKTELACWGHCCFHEIQGIFQAAVRRYTR